jgi:hypothetical protein
MVKFASYLAGHLMESLRQFFCALRGHDDYMRFEKNRVYLECIECGHQSPGWTIDAQRPALRYQSRRGPTSRHGLARASA